MAHWQITIESNYLAIRDASDLLKQYCAQYHISPELSGQLELIMVEALNNVIKHAYQGEDGSKIYIEFTDAPQHSTIFIEDFGIPAPNLLHDSEIAFPDEDFLPEGGWGLPLIQALSDRISYCSDNKSNRLSLTKNKH